MKKNEQNVCFEICTFSISAADSDSEDELPPSVIVTDSWYEGNEDLPVYRWGLKHGMATKEAVKVLLAAAPGPKIASTVPTSISKNVLFVVDTSKLAALTDLNCDDMGAWSCTGKKTSWFGRDEYGDVCEVTPDDGVPYKVSRHHYVNDSLPSLKKVLLAMEKSGETHKYALVQYIFTAGEQKVSVKSHGNYRAKGKNPKPYRRTMESTKNMIAQAKGKPREVFHAVVEQRGGIHSIESSGEYPRDRAQIYNIRRHSVMKGSIPPTGVSDPLLEILKKAKEQQQMGDMFIRDVQMSPEPMIFLATDQQLLDVQRFCTNPESFCVFGIDSTYNIAGHYYTFGTYRNLLIHKNGVHPVCIGPGILHKRRLESSYFNLPASMLKYKPETRGILVVGTDGEDNIVSAACRGFTSATMLRCDLHLKENVKMKLADLKISGRAASTITADIFGRNLEADAREGGLIDCSSPEEYDQCLQNVVARWRVLHPRGEEFIKYFLDHKSDVIRDTMRADIRSMCGLGFPPAVYTQNANECKNRFVKEDVTEQGLQPMKNLVTAIEKIGHEINRQFDEQFLAVIGKGEYRLVDKYSHLGVEETSFYRMTTNQQLTLKRNFFTASVSSTTCAASVLPSARRLCGTISLSVSPETSEIISVPFPILCQIFQKADDLHKDDTRIWKLPGQTAAAVTWMAASTHNPESPHTVKTWTNGRVECDRKCVQWCTHGLCSHSIAVAEKAGILQKFMRWFNGKRRQPKLTALADVNMPSSSGQKGSAKRATQRRRGPANAKKVQPTSVVSRVTPPRPDSRVNTSCLVSAYEM